MCVLCDCRHFLSFLGQQFLQLGDCKTGIQALGASFCAVHNCMALVHRVGVVDFVESLCLVIISAVYNPSVRLHKYSRSQVLFRIPPVTGARCGAASAHDTLIQSIQYRTVLDRLKVLLIFSHPNFCLWSLLQERLDWSVLRVKVVHVRYKVLDNIHVWEWVQPRLLFRVCVDRREACQSVDTLYVHCTWSTNPLTARPSEW